MKQPPKNGVKSKYKHTLIIDGNGLFKLGFFGAKDEYNRNGEKIGGIYQFFTILRKLLNEDVYNDIFIFWDGKFSGKLRYDIYPNYKLSRGKKFTDDGTEPQDENELLQRFIVQEYIETFGLKQLEDPIVESDDFIGYYCLNKKPNEFITICTNDRDMCQLLSNDIRIYFSDIKKFITVKNYSEFFNHHHSNSFLIKLITGDSSDNIKGIKSIKEKTLLKFFPELKEKTVYLDDIKIKASLILEERINQKLKPLKALENLINGFSDNNMDVDFYELNDKLINLKKPLITDNALHSFNELISSEYQFNEEIFKDIILLFKRDGLDRIIGLERLSEYLLPFKNFIKRKKNQENEKTDRKE